MLNAQTRVYGKRAQELRLAATACTDPVGKSALLHAAEWYDRFLTKRAGACAVRELRAPKPKLVVKPTSHYLLQMWDKSGSRVEKTLAESPDSRVAYAAYFQAAREFPMRLLTLSQNERVLARWYPPGTGRH